MEKRFQKYDKEAFYWNFSVIIQSQNVKSDTAVARASLYSSSQNMNMQNT